MSSTPERPVHINGRLFDLQHHSISNSTTLLEFLRENRFTGAKLGCGEGGCGACTVMVSHSGKDSVPHTVNACITPLLSVVGCNITTVEGIGNTNQLHPVQESMAKLHGSQCGFCTPGFVVSMYTQLQQCAATKSTPEQHTLVESLDGNLCRCTGYRSIYDVTAALAADCKAEQKKDTPHSLPSAGTLGPAHWSGTSSDEFDTAKVGRGSDYINPKNSTAWIHPHSLSELCAAKAKYPKGRLVAGNTEVGIERNVKNILPSTLIYVGAVKELTLVQYDHDKEKLKVGAAVTLTKLKNELEKLIETHNEVQTRGLRSVHQILGWFGSTAIRNMGTIGGNICTASPISDLIPSLIVLGADVSISSDTDERILSLDDFIKGYRTTALAADEVLRSIHIPVTLNRPDEAIEPFTFMKAYKQCKRREDDISIVTAAFLVKLQPVAAFGSPLSPQQRDEIPDDQSDGSIESQTTNPEGSWKIKSIDITYGGMGPLFVRPCAAISQLTGAKWELNGVLESALQCLSEELQLPVTAPGGMAEYRTTLSLSMFYKFFVATCLDLEKAITTHPNPKLPKAPTVADDVVSAAESYLEEDYRPRFSTHNWPKEYIEGGQLRTSAKGNSDKARDAIGKDLPHSTAHLAVTGHSKYTADIPDPKDCYHMGLVVSAKPYAKILSVDASEALKMDGVRGIITHDDIPGKNAFAAVPPFEEPVLAVNQVECVGQIIGAIVADSQFVADLAARAVKIEYEELPGVILSMEEGIRQESFIAHKFMHRGSDPLKSSAEDEIEKCEVQVEGSAKLGGQEHFYFETNSSIVWPGEDGEMLCTASTQCLTQVQEAISSTLALPRNKVQVKIKRIGGGFGGKESRCIPYTLVCAIAAYKYNTVCRINVRRDMDMLTSGGRHAVIANYKLGADKNGKLIGMHVKGYLNAGWSLDLSGAVLGKYVQNVEGPYYIPHQFSEGHAVKTNLASNTAFRGFGSPQGMFVAETMMDHLADQMGLEPSVVRERNLLRGGQQTMAYLTVEEDSVHQLWTSLKEKGDYDKRREQVTEYNAHNRWKKRGLAIIPTRFGIGIDFRPLNQGSSLVHIYTDGTVYVSHGGVEMGQGLNMKIIQVVANEFDIPTSQIFISETCTDKVPNSLPTSASLGSDIFCMATLNACEQLSKRLTPVREKLPPTATFAEISSAAWFDQISLSATGHYGFDINYDWSNPNMKERGRVVNYFTYGVGMSEVEVDILTGDSRLLRVDIGMDLGKSLNPAIDMGQIEGAFTQGMGWFTSEELVWGDNMANKWLPDGVLATRGPGTYKIPCMDTTPVEWHLYLHGDAPNPRAVHSSRAVGEPPLFLGSSVFFAVKDAIRSVRSDNNMQGAFDLEAPATPERVRLACADFLTKFARPQD